MNDIGTTSWGPVPTLASFLVQLSSLPPLQSLPCLTTAEARAMGTSVKSKAAFVDVVLEGMDQEGGWQIPEAIAAFLRKLGKPLSPPWLAGEPSAISTQALQLALNDATRRPGGNPAAVVSALQELVATERSFVLRMRALNDGYAKRLTELSKGRKLRIIGPYEARIVCFRVDDLVASSQRLLKTLEGIRDNASAICCPGDQGEWCRILRAALEAVQVPFRQYLANYEGAKTIEQALQKDQRFADFCERTKAAMYNESLGRVGLSELIMEPIQRVPRYKLLLERMLANLGVAHPGRRDLAEALKVCDRLATGETDEESRRAAHMWALNRSIDGFPAILIRDDRNLVDAIDVWDVPLATSSSTQETLCCTLFLFSDTLVIAKRPRQSSGRALAGLGTDTHELLRSMQESRPERSQSGVKKGKLLFKGMVKILDLVAAQSQTSPTTAAARSFDVFFSRPPTDPSARWNARPQRHFVVAAPGMLGAEAEKQAAAARDRFLRNLWRTQALVKAVGVRPVLLDVMTPAVPTPAPASGPSRPSVVPHGSGQLIEAHWNLYERECYDRERRKHKVVLQLDATGAAPALDFALNGPPYFIVRATFKGVKESDCVVDVRTRADPERVAEATVPVDALSSFVVRAVDWLGISAVPPRFPCIRTSASAAVVPLRAHSGADGTPCDVSATSRASASRPVSVSVEGVAARTPTHSGPRRPLGPCRVETPAPRPPWSSATTVKQRSGTVPEQRSLAPSEGGGRKSGAGLTKRRRMDGEERSDENRRPEEETRRDKLPDAWGSPSTARTPPSRANTVRPSRRRTSAVDAKMMLLDHHGDVAMEKGDGSKDPTCDMKSDVKQLKQGVGAVRTLLSNMLAARGQSALQLGSSMGRLPRLAGSAREEDFLLGQLDVTALSTWLDVIGAIAGDLDRSLRATTGAVFSKSSSHERQAHDYVQARVALWAAQTDASTLRGQLEHPRRRVQSLEAQMDKLVVENDGLYEAFNQELDRLFVDVQMPPDRAVARMAVELRVDKAAKADLARRLGQETRKRARVETERDEARTDCRALFLENERLRLLLGSYRP